MASAAVKSFIHTVQNALSHHQGFDDKSCLNLVRLVSTRNNGLSLAQDGTDHLGRLVCQALDKTQHDNQPYESTLNPPRYDTCLQKTANWHA